MKKRILIAGGSSGLGLDLAKHYVNEGHTVCVTVRHDPKLAALSDWFLDCPVCSGFDTIELSQ